MLILRTYLTNLVQFDLKPNLDRENRSKRGSILLGRLDRCRKINENVRNRPNYVIKQYKIIYFIQISKYECKYFKITLE